MASPPRYTESRRYGKNRRFDGLPAAAPSWVEDVASCCVEDVASCCVEDVVKRPSFA